MKILVTGASGFIGGAFMRRFADVENLSLYSVGRRKHANLPASVIYTSVALERLDDLDFVPDVVIHAAGRASPWGITHDYYRDNVETTRHVINFCHRRGFPRLLFISSAAVYYRFKHQFGLQEGDSIGPEFTSEYGRSKRRAEQLIESYSGEKTILRPCAVFGEGDRLLLPPLLAAAKKGRLMRLRCDGENVQADIMHVDVLCDYLMRAVTRRSLRPCYNLSANRTVETERLLIDVLRQLGLPPPKKTVRLSTAIGLWPAIFTGRSRHDNLALSAVQRDFLRQLSDDGMTTTPVNFPWKPQSALWRETDLMRASFNNARDYPKVPTRQTASLH